MTERERLIEILLDGATFTDEYKNTARMQAEYAADHLLANGVIVPPCKVGDITYILDYEVNNHLESKLRGIAPSVVEAIVIEDEGVWIENEHAKYHITSFGETIFLTKEDAEKALKEKQG
jgi:hypothetical protein